MRETIPELNEATGMTEQLDIGWKMLKFTGKTIDLSSR
jgi:hypothetical protein